MKSKVIKKIFRFFLWFIGILLLVFVSFYFALRSPEFQTWATNRIGGYFSGKWKTTVRVEGVSVELWKKIVLEGVYVEDQHRDTLLYAEKLKLDIGNFNSDSNTIFVNNVIFKNATVKLKKYIGDSALNLQFIIDEFTSKDTTKKEKQKWNIGIGGIALDNIHFAYKTEEDTSYAKGINFSDLRANSIYGKISDIKFDADTIRCNIREFSLEEKSGFVLKDLYTEASISSVKLNLEHTKIFTNNSQVTANVFFSYNHYDDFNHFIDSIKIKSQFNSSNIEMADIAYFAHDLFGMKKRIFFNGKVSGRVSDLKGKNILLAIGDETSFMGNFTMTGLPDINQTFMSFDAKELRTSKEGIEKIPLPPFNENHSIGLPSNVSLFGTIKFKGNFSGFYNDFVTYGTFNTALGQISTDLSMKNDSASGLPIYHGKFSCYNFNLGKFFESEKYIGIVSMNVNLNGKGLQKENTNLTMDGKVSSIGLNGYDYKNIDVKGKFAKRNFDGMLSVMDENLILDFNGNMDFSKSPTRINFISEIKRANLNKINILKQEEYAGITAKINVEAVGNNIDDVTAKMKLNDVKYYKGKEIFDFQNSELNIVETKGEKDLVLNSIIADAHLNGKFKPAEVALCLNDLVANYLPSYVPRLEEPLEINKLHSKKYVEHLQNFSFDVKFKNTNVATRAFLPSLSVSSPAFINGNYDEEKNNFSFSSSFPQVDVTGYKFEKCNIEAKTKNDMLSFNTSIHRIALADSVWIDSVKITSEIKNDSLNFLLNWKNNTAVKYEGNIPGYVSFAEKPKIKLKILPAIIVLADSVWKINSDNEIVKDSSFISIKNLEFISGKQRIKVEGNISHVKEDQLYFILSSFALSNLNPALKGSGFSIYGTISGNTSLSNLYEQPVFGSSIEIQKLKMNNELIGDGNLSSIYDGKKRAVNFNGNFQRDDAGSVKLSGNYFPFKKDSSIEAEADVRDFHLEFFEPFLKENFENIKGNASAELKISGTPAQPKLNGIVRTNVKNIHVNYLGTDYHFEGEIPVEPNSFDFSNITFYDVNNNSADVINGKIYHDNFKKLQLDIDLSTDKFLVLNTTEKDNSTYYGKFFATGIANVFGYLDNINLSATVKTDKAKNVFGKNEYTQLFIPLSSAGEIKETGFISFVKNDTSKIKQPKYKINTTGFTMDLKLDATPDAQAQLIFDEKVGDIIKAKGKGNIEMLINEFGDFKMFGDYTVEEGDYLFTLKNVVNKKFRIENGGVIRWAGDPSQAEINMNAIYQVRSSLSPLFHDYEQTEATKKRYPVDLVMNLSGKLLSPDINFDVRLPTVDDFTRQQAFDRFKNSDLEVNRQVFSLLFTNSFSPPPDMKSDESTAGGPGAGTVTSTEMLSNQLSNWLSQISNKFDVGVHYRPGDVVNKDEVQVALSTQLFNDKLSIDGSVANNPNTNSQNTSNIVGDINIDYKLTEDGKLRAKAFNKANEGNILDLQKGPYTQGVGIFYRHEFETIGELYKKFISKLKKKKEKS
ncbi:MAG: translocation/assembly module TamB domain-containing protein [Bacteroidetes bacterium]|nr:translocation/assembly module TamB domain-containing protein [Bacteroidota bacterium]